jgi:pimeloyl-ACP methyl ester carboxylesterase/class 3 adenylate cyclase
LAVRKPRARGVRTDRRELTAGDLLLVPQGRHASARYCAILAPWLGTYSGFRLGLGRASRFPARRVPLHVTPIPRNASMDVPAIRYTRTADGLNIAYQVLGEGPFDLVFVPQVISNVEIFWENPRWAGFMRELASFCRLLLFDRRGVGLSDRPGGVPPLEQRMDDVRAVMDAVGSERAALFGTGPDGAMAALFAATYPERVTALVLYAVPPRGMWAPDYPWGRREDEARQLVEEGERRFAQSDYVAELAQRSYPTIAADEEAIAWAVHATRLSATPATYAALRRMNLEIDVRAVLPTIRVPTLVLHRTDDRFVPVDVSRLVAEQIPGALYRELDGIDHIPWIGDPEDVVAAVREFIDRIWRERPWEEVEPDRVLATVLFTDIVGSTEKAMTLGDAQWGELLHDHHVRVRGQLARFRGREIDTAGDGFFATFDGPARAIGCARAVRDAVAELGIEIRAGLHAGECEVIDGKVGGVAVHIGARVAAEAEPDEILVSGTVKDLVAGSGIQFEDRGLHTLKGVGEWHLFAVSSQAEAA